MASALLENLSAASTLAASDLFYVKQAGARGLKATGTQLLALVGTAYVPLAGGASMAGPLSLVNSTTQQIAYVYNTYTDASNYERLTLTGVAGTSVNITAETLGTGGDNLNIVLTSAGSGAVVFNAHTYVVSGGDIYSPMYRTSSNQLAVSAAYGFVAASDRSLIWSSTTEFYGTADAGLGRNADGVVEVNNGTAGTFRDLKLRNLIQTAYHEVAEMTAPAAPATNSVRIYAEDNGAGKTRLMALFASGAAQQIAIEP